MSHALAKSKSIAAAVVVIRAAIDDTLADMERTTMKALRVGLMLIEFRPTVAHGQWEEFVEEHFPKISLDTATRWMRAAENCLLATKIDVKALGAGPLHEVIDVEAKLEEPAREARQLLLDFAKDKTIADCLRAVVVEGDEPHRITRAHNGKTKGGKGDKDRKDWPTFIGRKLSDIGQHLKHWQSMSGAQLAQVESQFKAHFSKWPADALAIVKKLVTEELKNR